jgi:predicted O-methyltransferase YrrM
MILYRSLKYLKYILLARHARGHGIHSPFVFNLIIKVFRKKTDQPLLRKVEQIRKKMRSDKKSILVNDPDSNSEKSKMRRVSSIARYSQVSEKYGRLLSNLASEFGNPVIIEMGTSLGLSTLYMAGSSKDAAVYTIEGCKEIAELAQQNFFEAGLNNIKVFAGSFDEILPELLKSDIKPGLIFIDGILRKKAVIHYFNMLAEVSDNKTAIVINDINYSKEMAEAWDEIKLHKKVSVTVDIFRMGIVFFREGISHNNYVIRY